MVTTHFLQQLQEELARDGIEKVVVGAVIHNPHPDERGILVVERAVDDFMGGLVELPSGAVDKGEDLFDALKREVAEETGLFVEEILDYAGCFDYISGSGKKARQFNFVVLARSGEVRLNPQEHQHYYWVDPQEEQFDQLNISDKTRKSILNAIDF